MIIDSIDNYKNYENLGIKISLALNHISTTDFDNKEPGRYDIDGDNIFVMVNDYNTKNINECRLEGHHKYIDVQYLVKGSELMGYVPLSDQAVSVEYDDEGDVAFFEGHSLFVKLDKGMFVIFFPEDLHMPGIGDGDPVRKVVVKVKI
ncbi:toxin-antitoxin biofilm protein TabA [bacterium BMS3Bbin09]|nr:toxin-antitoxin biofilm protein TabA [bacterium BMS3Bbin09]